MFVRTNGTRVCGEWCDPPDRRGSLCKPYRRHLCSFDQIVQDRHVTLVAQSSKNTAQGSWTCGRQTRYGENTNCRVPVTYVKSRRSIRRRPQAPHMRHTCARCPTSSLGPTRTFVLRTVVKGFRLKKTFNALLSPSLKYL